MGWQPIETAPRNTYIDLWVVGTDDMVDFYCPNAKKVKGKPLRHGRATHYKWVDDGLLSGWYSNHGLGQPLSVTPTHWMPIPDAPSNAIAQRGAACGASAGAMGWPVADEAEKE